MGLSHSSDPSELDRNLRFYKNEIKSRPWPGHTIEEMLLWCGKYSKLENNHSYIQWLFPTSEGSGMNPSAQPLREHEAEAIRDDEIASARVLMAYKMMLDFYGMRLVSRNSGAVARSDNWRDRYEHLNRSVHNYRRITRIIQSLGELGYERFQVPWINFLIEESVVHRVLPNLNGPCMKHWIGAIKEDREREHMHENYIELFKKPRARISALPNPGTSNNSSAAANENKIDISKRVPARNVSDSDALVLQKHNVKLLYDSSCDMQKSEIVERFSYETADAVDHGPAAESSHALITMPSSDVETRANGEHEQRNTCNENVHMSGKVGAKGHPSEFTDDSSVDFGCAQDDQLACR